MHPRVSFQPENLDLTSLHSVQHLAQGLINSIPRLDAILLNAGVGGFTGINWPLAIWSVITNLVAAVTYPTFKLSSIGATTLSQKSSGSNPDLSQGEDPPLGEIFCANVFGHYLLAHGLVPLLSRSSSTGRIIWISSLEAYAHTFSPADIQGLAAQQPYESSKRLTDILALTANLRSTLPYVSRFLSASTSPPPRPLMKSLTAKPSTPKIYLAHPGICATAIIPLAFPLQWLMTLAFYLARLLGSPWHTVSPYKGACAPVWLALTSSEELEAMETAAGAEAGREISEGDTISSSKWGSGTYRLGRERVLRTAVEGAGSAEWEELSRETWREMERLREEWEARIGRG